jgi:hypothetical protein
MKAAGVAAAGVAGVGAAAPARLSASPISAAAKPSKHVLLISVDGIHAIDLARWVESNPVSVLALLSEKGYTYSAASCSKPSDSFPGLMALVTGGSNRSTGIWYDVAYDRDLLPPLASGLPAVQGTVTQYMEAIDIDMNKLDGGVVPPRAIGDYAFTLGQGIDPTQLPRDPNFPHNPVYPWKFIRTNTIFEVAKAHGRRTAWADKHVGAYQVIHGPSSPSAPPFVDDGFIDYFSPEINSLAAQLEGGLPAGADFTKSQVAIKLYDSLKVKAVVNQCKGLNSTGTHHVGTPAIFGMNFQVLSVAQKLWLEELNDPLQVRDSALQGAYLDADGKPNTAIVAAMQFVDDALGEMVVALAERDILEHTTVIITAKHGQSPINLQKRRIVGDSAFDKIIKPIVGDGNYAFTADDACYIWLRNKDVQKKTPDVVEALWGSPLLNNLAAQADPNVTPPLPNLPWPALTPWPEPNWPANPGIEYILWGDTLKLQFNDPLVDSRTPDIIVVPTPGVIYAGKNSPKTAEHGGISFEDLNVALLVSNPSLSKRQIKTPVQTTQVAPTILKLLGMDPNALHAVVNEKTDELPAFDA